MAAFKVTKDVYSVGILNPNLRVFDIVMNTEFGTTYNAYIIRGKEKTALIETVHHRYFDAYLENIEQVCPLSEIDYLIMNHNEPDHSGCVDQLLARNPKITVIASQAGSIYLKNIANRPDLKVQVAKDGDKLDLGGKELTFISAPFLHWPDSMFTYDPDDRMVFTCDFLGSHYCEPLMLDCKISYPQSYESAFKGYYDAIFGPFKPYVLKGLEKLRALDFDFVGTSHGPVLTKGTRYEWCVERYEEWSQPHHNPVKTLPIFFCSAYGNTGNLAIAIREGILSVIPDAKVDIFDIIDHDMGDLSARLNSADGFLIGTPTINRDAVPPVWVLLSHFDSVNNQKKSCAVFGSYGWSGEGVPAVMDRLRTLKLNVFEDGLKVPFVPSAAELEKAKEFGASFAKSL